MILAIFNINPYHDRCLYTYPFTSVNLHLLIFYSQKSYDSVIFIISILTMRKLSLREDKPHAYRLTAKKCYKLDRNACLIDSRPHSATLVQSSQKINTLFLLLQCLYSQTEKLNNIPLLLFIWDC